MKYYVVRSVRHQSKRTMELINKIASKVGTRIDWDRQYGENIIERQCRLAVHFRRHGNKFANWLELWSYDLEALKQIKQSFPEDFEGHEVQEKEEFV